MGFKDNILKCILTPLILLFIGASYVRFVVNHDYMVAYEGTCDEYTENCFIGCEDEECTTEYYYSKMQKYAPDIFAQCGRDITDCESANTCLDGERECSIVFCDPELDGDECELLTEDDFIEPVEESSTEDEDFILESDESQQEI